jgi:hypothetical protein
MLYTHIIRNINYQVSTITALLICCTVSSAQLQTTASLEITNGTVTGCVSSKSFTGHIRINADNATINEATEKFKQLQEMLSKNWTSYQNLLVATFAKGSPTHKAITKLLIQHFIADSSGYSSKDMNYFSKAANPVLNLIEGITDVIQSQFQNNLSSYMQLSEQDRAYLLQHKNKVLSGIAQYKPMLNVLKSQETSVSGKPHASLEEIDQLMDLLAQDIQGLIKLILSLTGMSDTIQADFTVDPAGFNAFKKDLASRISSHDVQFLIQFAQLDGYKKLKAAIPNLIKEIVQTCPKLTKKRLGELVTLVYDKLPTRLKETLKDIYLEAANTLQIK